MTGPNVRERILPRLIEDELKESFLDYSMSVIVSRALPDVRDGLKPVHRRILYAMHELGLVPGRPYKKAATVVGDVLGKYHPHGDIAVYDSLVRMVQDFSLRYPLIDGQGNFGSVDGDSAAAYRYTEARLTRVAMTMLEDIDKNTVAFVPNFDDRLQEPTVLPGRLPNLLVNGSAGIAVGMTTNIPPHNLSEVVQAIVHLVDHPNATIKDIRKFVKGPDFPTGAIIYGREGIKECYEKGRGRIVIRARAIAEEKESTGKQQIVVTEFPYQVSPERVHEQIRDLVLAKKLEGISDVRNESDKEGIRLVIELKRDVIPMVVLNQLYKHTQMQQTFGAIMLALVDGTPIELTLLELLQYFIEHRHTVITRRTEFQLQRAQDREHILEGLKIAVDNIDEVIKIIKKSKDTPSADAALRKRFKLSEKQSAEILNMRLARLTALEITKLEEELKDVRKFIKECKEILASKPRRMKILKEELTELAHGFGDERRTEIVADQGEFSIEDLIAEEDMVITVSHAGYIKRLPVSAYRRQRRGGKGVISAHQREDDWVEHLFIASTHDYVMFFTEQGQCYWLKVHEIPQAARAARASTSSPTAMRSQASLWRTTSTSSDEKVGLGPGSAMALTPLGRRLIGVDDLADQLARRLDALRRRLDTQHVAPQAHRLGQPQRVEADPAAHVDPGRAGRQPEVGDEHARLGLLEIVHALERLREGLGRPSAGALAVGRRHRGLSHGRHRRRPAQPPSRPSSASARRA